MKWVTRALVALFVLILLAGAAAGAGYFWFQKQVSAPGPRSGQADVTVFIPRGAGVISVGQQLEKEGLISDARLFRLAAKLSAREERIKAGEYLIPADSSMLDILERLQEGKVILHAVQVIEGSTIKQAMKAIAAADFLAGDLPETPEEGAFLPDTYHFMRGTTRQEVVDHLKAAQTALVDEIWSGRQEKLPFSTQRDAIILASIVEKETGGLKDEDVVASVFINRLNLGMALETDAAVHYGVNGGERLTKTVQGKTVQRGLYKSELKRDTPYNTYLHAGLPPTPICNPGAASLRAVLKPADTDYLFFVADGTGGHVFAKKYSDHLKNVDNWRKIETARAKANGGLQ